MGKEEVIFMTVFWSILNSLYFFFRNNLNFVKHKLEKNLTSFPRKLEFFHKLEKFLLTRGEIFFAQNNITFYLPQPKTKYVQFEILILIFYP